MLTIEPVSAVYESGLFRLLEPLPLSDHQRVSLSIFVGEPVSPSPDAARLARIREQAAVWLAQQPPEAVREPRALSVAERGRLDADFDRLLAEIHRYTAGDSEDEIAALVDEAVTASRNPHA